MTHESAASLSIAVEVNGRTLTADVRGGEAAVDTIRERFGLTGTKYVCGGGVCGACTALVDGAPTATCLLPATALDETAVTTVEGLGGHDLHPVQRAFMVHDGLQCGYCTPGFVVDAAAFVDRWRAAHGTVAPDRHTIADALAGHLCRCGAYAAIYRAVAAACRGDFDDGEPVAARAEARAKVTGAARYTTDVTLPGMLHGVVVRSPVAAGVVRRLDLDAARRVDGVRAVVDLQAGECGVRWAGQPLAAVAADDATTARRAAAVVAVDIADEPAVFDVYDAVAPDAPQVHATRSARRRAPSSAEGLMLPAPWRGNRRGPTAVSWLGPIADRRIAAARRRSDPRLFAATFTTAVQVHTCFEPHAAVADWSDPQRLRLWVSTQVVDAIRHDAAEHAGLPPERVEVIAEHVGGGFGSKQVLSVETVAAMALSRAARSPVRVVLDRREELTAAGARPGTHTRIALLADDDGDLAALTVDTAGAGGVSVGSLTAVLAVLMYGRGPRRSRDFDVVTNAPPGCPFRGPGGPPAAWALEQGVDELAHRLGEDPIGLRQRWDGSDHRQRLYVRAAALPVWRDRPATGAQCVHPHPSSLGMALLASDAHVSVTGRGRMPVAELWGDGSDPHHDHQLTGGQLLTHVHLPDAWAGERDAYFRSISRFEAEWPLVEAVARLVVADGVVTRSAVAVGGVATVPLRLPAVEASLRGRPPTPTVLATVARAATATAAPLPMTRYKVDLLVATVLEVLERAAAAAERPV